MFVLSIRRLLFQIRRLADEKSVYIDEIPPHSSSE